MSVREAKQRIHADEWPRWVVYDAIEGLMPVSAQQFAQMCALLCNYLASKPGRRFTMQDFLPQWTPPHPVQQQSPEEIERTLLLALGGHA